MSREYPLLVAMLLSLVPSMVLATPAQKRHIYHWHGYGFLPGYHQPPDISVPIYGSRGSIRATSGYVPRYWYNGGRYYLGNPGFFHRRYNGGSFGPCWTWTPIGPIWNCG